MTDLSLAEFLHILDDKLDGRVCDMSWVDKRDGSQIGAARVSGVIFATWKAELINPPLLDGVTPRGPKKYTVHFCDSLVEAN